MADSGSFNTSGYDGRYLRFEWSVKSQSVSANTTTINWSLKGAGGSTSSWYMAGNFKVVIDGSVVYSSSSRIQLYNGTTVASGTFMMTHSSNGSRSFSASAEAGIYYFAVNCSGSESWSLPTIPRAATISSATSFYDTDNPTIKYSNPAGSSVSSLQACISLTGSTDNIAYRDISKTGSSYTFNLTEAERNILRAATPNNNQISVRFYVKTVIGGQTYTNYTTTVMTIKNANPTFSAAYLDSNSTTSTITGNDQQIIQSQSILQVNITNATALKSATLSTVKCVINGTTYNGNLSGSSYTFNIGTLNISSNTTAAITVTDSRGNSTSQNLSIIIVPWSLPTAIITTERHNNYYSDTDITVDGDYASVNGKNTLTIQLRYKQASDSTYQSWVAMQDNVMQTFTFDNNYAWDVQVKLTDKFGSTTYNLQVSRGLPTIYFDRLLSSVGINCFPKDDDSLEVNGTNILKAILFESGDTLSITNAQAAGMVTSAKQTLRFTVVVPKSLANVTNITVSTLKLNVRHADGGYTLTNAFVSGGYNILTDSNLTVTTSKAADNMITFNIATSQTFNGTNNSTQTVSIESMVLSFS